MRKSAKSTNKHLSDDMIDGITIVVLILTVASAVVYWLATLS